MGYFVIDRYIPSNVSTPMYAVFDTATLQSQWFYEDDLRIFGKKAKINGLEDDKIELIPLKKVSEVAGAMAKLSNPSWLGRDEDYLRRYGESLIKATILLNPHIHTSKPYNIIIPQGVALFLGLFDSYPVNDDSRLVCNLYLPDSLVCIEGSMFRKAHFLNKVVFSKYPIVDRSFTILDYAFYMAFFHKGIEFNEETTYFFGEESFAHTNIEKLECRVEAIDCQAFSACTELEFVELSGGGHDMILHDYAFSSCQALKEVIFHITQELYILKNVFEDCISLKSVKFDRMARHSGYSLGDFCFGDCSSLEEIYLPVGISGSGVCQFFGCTALRRIHCGFLSMPFFAKNFVLAITGYAEDLRDDNPYIESFDDLSEFIRNEFSPFMFIGISKKCKFTLDTTLSEEDRDCAKKFMLATIEELNKHRLFYEDLVEDYNAVYGGGGAGIPDSSELLTAALTSVLSWLDEIKTGDYEWAYAEYFDLDNIN